MANSKKLTSYTGSSATVAVPTSVSNVLVREIVDDAFTTDVVTVEVDAYKNDISGAPWGAQSVVWLKEPICTITFDANGGTGSMSSRKANIGISYTLPQNEFTAPGSKEFKNWLVGSTEYAAGAQVVFSTATATVKANWYYPQDTNPMTSAEATNFGYTWEVV